MQHDTCLRAAARADELAPVGFDEAEKYGTIHYRRAVEAAQGARVHLLFGRGEQPSLF
jgi:hypothetical protein